MKRTILLFLSVMMTVIMTAGDVTPQQALQQAQKFLQQTPSGMKRSQAEVPQLKMAGRVSGLYVFNAEQNQGYVIVSNDDRTTPILGYSETGTLDPDNMPCNMRAWLQGYADEIAWLNEHNIQPITVPVVRRTPSAVKTPIAPLVKTHWDQGSPYNDNCPYYKYDEGSYSYKVTITDETGYEHCATGCVATAMAQVMYYNQWPTAATAAIPSYSWQGYTIGGLPATTFDWANMKLNYTGSETAEQNAAVAKLMQYCGVSLEMNYGPESGSNTPNVADALKSYFDYNSSTVQFVSRSFYTYHDWINLLYHELSQGRPICYGGASTGGGHEFVCDGYQGEDFFHINWGWGGMSDDYFKLSALDPDAQGIGGSSSTDGFHYGQDAVIGIQKSTESGEVSTITGKAPNLKCNSITLSKATVAVGEMVDITLNVTNKDTEKEYSGDIYLGYYESSYYLLEGSDFVIPAGETKNCVIHYTPDTPGTYNLVFFVPDASGSYVTNGVVYTTLTVNSGGGGSGNPTSYDVDLSHSLTVENSENISGKQYIVLGNIFKGQLTITNPSATYDYDGYCQYDLWQYNSGWKKLGYKSTHVVVPANGNVVIPIEYDDMQYGTMFEVDVIYFKGGSSWTATDEVGYYYPQPAIITYAADGTSAVAKVTSTSYNVPAGKLAVDLTGLGITTVTNAEPNCLFIIGDEDTPPSGSGNIVVKSGSNYTAANITLTDGNDFYSPIDFTATNIEFTYSNDRWADGTNGWNTIMLPFDVTSVTANGTDIDWFHSGSDTGKQFWLKKFTGDDTSAPKVYFDYTDEMKANTPYIIALPGNRWGTEYDLSGKTIKFIGANAEVKKSTSGVVTGGNYRFVGDTKAVNTEKIYCINAAGNMFELKATGGSPAFRPFFKADMFDRTVTSLGIGNGGETTGIETMSDVRSVMSDVWYDLQGRRVENPTKGVYIKNGKLFIKK